jgi:hypothetical protein
LKIHGILIPVLSLSLFYALWQGLANKGREIKEKLQFGLGRLGLTVGET